MVLYGIPDDGVVNAIVAMYDAVAHAYDFAHVWVLMPIFWFDIIKLAERFTHYLELSFHSRPKQQIGGVIVERRLACKLGDRLTCVARIQ
jgi:hypothetical protein